MTGFIRYTQLAVDTERAIERAGKSLGLDWQDEMALGALVKEALDRRLGLKRDVRSPAPSERQRLNLCGLLVLMRRIELGLEESVGAPGFCAGPAWQALSRLLDREIESRLPAGA